MDLCGLEVYRNHSGSVKHEVLHVREIPSIPPIYRYYITADTEKCPLRRPPERVSGCYNVHELGL